MLAPPPGTMNMSSMYGHQYALPHNPAVYPHDYNSLPPLASALAPGDHSIPASMLQPHHREAIENPDAMARIRAQAELLSRAGVMPSGALTLAQPVPTTDTSAALPGLYAAAADAQNGQYDRFNLPSPNQWDSQRQYAQAKDFEAPYGPRSQSHSTVSSYSAAGAAGGEPTLQTHPPTTANSSSYDTGAGSTGTYLSSTTSLYTHQHSHHQHTRSDDVGSLEGGDFSDAASTSTGPSHSIPSSANSSAVHLPLPGFNNFRTQAELGRKESYDQRYQDDAPTQNHHAHEGAEGGFSATFGLLSLDDPNVMAGLATDGQPFFSGLTPFASGNGPGGLLQTPTQDLIAQLKGAGGREGENKEMRDFWKMYLRTPLSGPNSSGSGLSFLLQTPTGPGSQLGQGAGNAGRPTPSRRHSRVASLPSMKTPPLCPDERSGNSYTRPSTGDQYEYYANQAQIQAQHAAAGGGYNNNNSNVRTTLHGVDDLKSYEQAVYARRAPMHLNIAPKRKGSLAAHPPASVKGKSKSMSPDAPHASFAKANNNDLLSTSLPGGSRISELLNLNRPGSSSSSGSGVSVPSDTNTTVSQASSSLAHAFGSEHPAPPDSHGQQLPQALPQAQQSQANAYSPMQYRPSFKRIASQTLGPEHTKRALLVPAGWDHDEDEEEDEEREKRVEGVPTGEEQQVLMSRRMSESQSVAAGGSMKVAGLAAGESGRLPHAPPGAAALQS